MGNMGYCRFRNTLDDLADCNQNFDDELSEEEEKARLKLVKLCQKILEKAEDSDLI